MSVFPLPAIGLMVWPGIMASCGVSIRDDRAIYKLDPEDGKDMAKIQLTMDDFEPHGLDMDKHVVLRCSKQLGLPGLIATAIAGSRAKRLPRSSVY